MWGSGDFTTAMANASTGASNFANAYNDAKERRLRQRREAELHQLNMDLNEPARQRANFETSVWQQELENVKQQNQQMQNEMAKLQGQQALANLIASPTNDNGAFLRTMRSNPINKQLFEGVSNIEPITAYSTEEVYKQLKSQGYTDEQANEAFDNPNLRIMTYPLPNGGEAKNVIDLTNVGAMMGMNPSSMKMYSDQGKQNFEIYLKENPNVAKGLEQYRLNRGAVQSIQGEYMTQAQSHGVTPDADGSMPNTSGNMRDANGNLDPRLMQKQGKLNYSASPLLQGTANQIVNAPNMQMREAQQKLMKNDIELQSSLAELAAMESFRAKYGDEAFLNRLNKNKSEGNNTALMNNIEYLAQIFKASGVAKDENEAYLLAVNQITGAMRGKLDAYSGENPALFGYPGQVPTQQQQGQVSTQQQQGQVSTQQQQGQGATNSLYYNPGYKEVAKEIGLNVEDLRYMSDLDDPDALINIDEATKTPNKYLLSDSQYKVAEMRHQNNKAKLGLVALHDNNVPYTLNYLKMGAQNDAETSQKDRRLISKIINTSDDKDEVKDINKQLASTVGLTSNIDDIANTDLKIIKDKQGFIDSPIAKALSYTPLADKTTADYTSTINLLSLNIMNAMTRGVQSDQDMKRLDNIVGTLTKNEVAIFAGADKMLSQQIASLKQMGEQLSDPFVKAWVVDRRIVTLENLKAKLNKLANEDKEQVKQAKAPRTITSSGVNQPTQVAKPVSQPTQVAKPVSQPTQVADQRSKPIEVKSIDEANKLPKGTRIIFQGREAVVE